VLAEGRHAPKEFKSLVAPPELIPVICAETGLKASDWPLLQDSLVIAKIDKALRPTRSTDFALQLPADHLGQRQTGHASSALPTVKGSWQKLAEAGAAERPVKNDRGQRYVQGCTQRRRSAQDVDA